MAKEKAPAYQWYPKDFNSDENVIVMSLEEEGAYRRLIDVCWLEGSIPDDIRKLAALCKNMPVKRMERIWRAVRPCFHPHPDAHGRLIHKKLERVRAERDAWIEKSRLGGLRSAAKRQARGKGGARVVGECLEPNGNTASASAVPPSIKKGDITEASRKADALVADLTERLGRNRAS